MKKMLSIEGIYDNGQLILNESLEIKRPVKVIVTFLEEIEIAGKKKIDLNKFSFSKSMEILKDYNESLCDAIIEERRSAL